MGELTGSLYEISPQLRELMTAEEFDSEQFDALAMAFEKKAEGITYFIGELLAFADMAKEESARINERAKAAKNRADRLKEYIKNNMENAEIYELSFGTKKLRVQNSPPSLVVDDEDKIPADYKVVQTVVKIDKAEIKRAIKTGKDVDGCHLEQSTNLRIR